MQHKISIIVPIYNTEKYLHRCIDSIISQSFTDWELILVDDGSTDNSPAICDEYAEKDQRIRVIHKENGGVCSARNLGIQEAKGEWLFFVDSDDLILEDSLSSVAAYMDDDIDAIQHNFHYQNGSKDTCPYIDHVQDISGREYLNKHLHASLCHHFLKKSIIDAHRLKMDETLNFSEDGVFVIEFFLFAERVRLIPVTVYSVTEREGSATHNPEKYEEAAAGELRAALSLIHFVNNRQLKISRVSRNVTSLIIYHLYEVNLYGLDTQKMKNYYDNSISEMRKLKYNTFFFWLISVFYDSAVKNVELLFSINYHIFKRLRKLNVVI